MSDAQDRASGKVIAAPQRDRSGSGTRGIPELVNDLVATTRADGATAVRALALELEARVAGRGTGEQSVQVVVDRDGRVTHVVAHAGPSQGVRAATSRASSTRPHSGSVAHVIPDARVGDSWIDGPWWSQDSTEHAKVTQAFAGALAGRATRFSAPLRDADCAIRPSDITLLPCRGDDGIVDAVLVESKSRVDHRGEGGALVEREEFHRDFERLAKLGSWEYDVDQDASIWSDGLVRIFGVSGEVPSRLAESLELVHADDRAATTAAVARAVEEGGGFDATFRIFHRASGGVRWMRSRGATSRAPDGHVDRVYGVAQDITESKAREDARAHAHTQSGNAERLAKVGAWTVDLETGETVCSPGYYPIFGLDPKERVHSFSEFWETVHEQDRARVRQVVEDAIRDGRAFQDEFRILKVDGSIVWVRARGGIETPPGGGPRSLVGAVQDVTDEKNATRKVRESQHELEGFADALTIFSAYLDLAGHVLRVGRETALKFGGDPESFIGASWIEGPWWTYDSEVHKTVQEKFAQAVAGERVTFTGYPRVGDDVRVVEVTLTPVFGEGGSIAFVVAEGVDQTEEVALKHALANEQKRLARANAELKTFNYTVSHDLRSPLRGVEAYASALIEDHAGELSPDAQTLVSSVKRECDRMGAIISDLLTLASDGAREVVRAPVDVTAVVKTVASALASREPARRVEILVAPGLVAYADPRLVRVLFENLVGNAWKFTGREPHARIEVGREPSARGPSYFVKDNGVGFDSSRAPDLFKPLTRLHAHQGFDGTGVGLATVQRIVHAHGGRVWVESRPGEGASFWFTLAARS